MIEVRNLVKKYGNHVAVNHLNFTVEKGKIYGFLGPNGAGKSTLMKILMGMYKKDSGSLSVLGSDEAYTNPDQALKPNQVCP